MTILNPRGRVSLLDLESDYPCIEMLYTARNGGLNPENCHTISTSGINSICGGCVLTEICDFDEVVCPTNQILVATNPNNHPGISNIWSTALVCQDLVESARNGELVSNSGCTTLKSSVKAAFQPGTFGVGVFDLTPCGLQTNNTGAPYREEDRDSDASGRLEGQSSQPTTTPLNPTHKPTEETTVETSLQPSDGPSLSASQQPSDEPSIGATEFPIASSSSRIKSPTPEFENCQLCDFENDSIFYLYKDFGISGTTFFEALSAPGHRDREECYEHENEHICIPKEPLHPDLDGCYLTDVTTFDELIGIQAVIPPNKAAYIGVFKDTMEVHTEAKECNQSSPTIGNNNACKVENYRQNLAYGHSKRKGTEDIEESIYVSEGSDQDMCPALKEGWFNYGKANAVPSNLWKKNQPSYCNVGPIQNAAAVWPVHPNGSNYGDMRDVNAGW
ncbi:hypothetical protein FRACYDRAFT_239918 [Fragilariopsis cylindrus CCMP1102]|uniref:Uncharacterized protein n=1 Tax=Fragilariopsis cylindrus CCMP1102 TaxID=635003 RepID=A0A1E7FAR4_9STRA|nr:hypothetical protein FRACYDRAFT_239918 [Fragilariopsis cylindrus CCMP1102]|eukprot:OEU15241.1 hypothetical protein FRACYDRAFT_239918 [Fragilariopsis cylindrus CCMP1102]